MTDRHNGYVVALETTLREDDAQATLDAIRHIRGVLAVEPVPATGIAADLIVELRVRNEVAAHVVELHRKVLRGAEGDR